MKLLHYHQQSMTIKNVTIRYIIALILFTASGVTLAYFMGKDNGMSQEIKNLPTEEVIKVMREADTFSVEKLENYIEELNLQYPEIVMAQAIIETGNFKSTIFRENNNLFGMKVAKIRPTTNGGEQYEHAYYTTWRESVLDYALYQSRYLCGLSKEEYLQYLSNYAEDSTYIFKIKKLIN